MSDCIFCKVVAGEVPSHRVYEDKDTFAFLDIFGATDGHVLVVHKRHEEKITKYKTDEVTAIFIAVQKVARAVENAFHTDILSIGINHGEPAGVHHAHVHIMPRFEGDGGGIMQTLPGHALVEKNFAKTAQRIKKEVT